MADWLDGTSSSRAAAVLESTITSNVSVIPWRRFSSLAFDGVTDVTTALNNALVSLSAAGGGAIQLPVGSGIISAPIIVQDMTGLIGQGARATWLGLADATGGMTGRAIIENHVSTNGTSDPNAQGLLLRDFGIWGNKANNDAGSGIYLDQNPSTSRASGDYAYDSDPHLSNLYIRECQDAGIYCGGRSGATYNSIQILNCDSMGIRPSFDSMLVNVHVGNSGLEGFYIDVPQVYLSACKAFYSGIVTPARGSGFLMTTGGGGASLSSCSAQDNRAAGFQITSCNSNVLMGCVADSNASSSAGGYAAGQYAAFQLEGTATGNRIHGGIAFTRPNGLNGGQENAVYCGSSATGNVIDVSQRTGSGGVTTLAPIVGTTSGNKITSGRQGGGFQTIAAATTTTPDPHAGSEIYVTMGASITTLAAPTYPYNGARMRFIFRQDGTGGKTVAFDSAYKLAGGSWSPTTTANKINIIEFIYSEAMTAWLETFRSTNIN